MSTFDRPGDYEAFFSHLRSLNFHFSDKWVIECVNYYKSNKPNISLEELKNEVAQQWLLVNLRDMKVPSLPPGLKSKDKIILRGRYAVQVESMLDSSRSCYSQLQKLKRIDTSDVDVSEEPKEREIKSSRCLVFEITDGVHELKAMEYQHIRKIKPDLSDLLPGFKIIVIGPVECRKGMIMLKDENIKVCGGEVDTLATTNSLKSILSKRLGLVEPESNDDHNINKENKTPSDGSITDLLSQNDDIFLSLPIETEMLMEMQSENEPVMHLDETNQNNLTNKRPLPLLHVENVSKQKKLDLDFVKQDEKDMEVECRMPSTSSQENIPMEIFTDDDIMEPLKPKNAVQTKLPSFFGKNSIVRKTSMQINSEPFVYLKQILSLNLKNPKTFKVKAVILTLKKKITIENDEFNLKATITDGSDSLDVDFMSSTLEEIFGFSPCEMVEMIKAKQTNSAIAHRVKESFTKAQDKLITLNCLMDLKIFPGNKVPIVLSLEEVTGQHFVFLKERSIKEKELNSGYILNN